MQSLLYGVSEATLDAGREGDAAAEFEGRVRRSVGCQCWVSVLGVSVVVRDAARVGVGVGVGVGVAQQILGRSTDSKLSSGRTNERANERDDDG